MKQAQSLLSKLINVFDKLSEWDCICGNHLERVYDPYNNEGAICDQCEASINKMTSIWHCNEKYNKTHIDGFDICQNCIDEHKATHTTSERKHDIFCNGDIKQCKHLQILMNTMNDYDGCNRNDNNDYLITNHNRIVCILNAFNHIVKYHCNDDDEFEFIYHELGGQCEVEKCYAVRRRYNNINNYINDDNNNIDEEDLFFVQDILDKIHCHFIHDYDIGARLTNKEKLEIYGDRDNSGDKMVALKNILHKKRSRNATKFSSNLLQQIEIKHENLVTFSYSYQFSYLGPWKHDKHYYDYKNFIEDWQESGVSMLSYRDLSVPAKFITLKEELTNNNISQISLSAWNNEIKIAMNHQKTDHCKKCVAKTNDYLLRNKVIYKDIPSKYGYIEGDRIEINHLMAIMIYCGYDQLQQKFSETYRKLDEEEDFECLKARHSNFYHFAKTLKDAVVVFGTMYYEGDVKIMYHGINNEMLFDSTQAFIHGPLSTTSSWNVAVQFTANNGLVLELVPATKLKYFDCCWLSRYSNESELLFIGGLHYINFVNITNVIYGWESKPFITALRVIDSMSNGNFFTDNPATIHMITEKHTKEISMLGLNGLSQQTKLLLKRLISHELSNYLPNQYEKFYNLHPYIDDLLHQICSNKQLLVIDYRTMNVDILEKYNIKRGYIGYKFLKSFFCNTDYEGINLNVFNTLFPSLKTVTILKLPSIDCEFLLHIFQYMTNNKASKINCFELGFKKDSCIKLKCDLFKNAFQNIGFEKLYFEYYDAYNLKTRILKIAK